VAKRLPFPADHRPWPVPERPWVQAQRWSDLLFAHWPLPPARLRRLVPAQLPLDTHDGVGWVGVVPFYLSGLRSRWLPPLPALRAFPELNVRTYVTLDGKPGVYFFSLDAGNPAAVAGARLLHLNYYYAWMAIRRRGEWIDYASQRLLPGPPTARFRGRYRPIGPASPPTAGSLDYWLTERYCLYTVDRGGRVSRLEIHHPPWQLQAAEAELDLNTTTAPIGLKLPGTRPRLHFSRRQDMVGWMPEPL
jgi:uncharacterized protein YqjF (DUF2071 family)